MIYPNCGVEVPDGSNQCTSCGAFFNVQYQGTPNYDAQYQGMSNYNGQYQGMQNNMQYQGTPSYDAQYQGTPNYDGQYQGMQNNMQYQPAPAKKKTGLIIGIISGVAAVALIIVLCVVFLGKGKLDGRYACSDMAWLGMDLYIEIDGDKFKLISEYDADGDGVISGDDERDVDEGTVKLNGDIVTLTIEDSSMDCAYDAKEGTITMDDGIKLVFKKE
ncbi:MAG: zinc ribbon domain-containing protein [Clostridium sp.]|nr:zinc ribbon domain-containing protein [Clostridium sp.]MCM1171531.1 zinc ribbon domain-containing protein [Clostridium sp.]MCM1209338.1 zinc ribbon domain-containing protein [Ruminococcus sp.]